MPAPRMTSLALDVEPCPTIDMGRPWWEARRPWPVGMRFEDVDPVVLEIELVADNAPLLPPEIPIPSTGALCVEAALAEPKIERDLDGVGTVPLRALVRRRRLHPLDRHSARRAVGATA